MDLLGKIAVVAIAIWVLWLALQPRYAFVVRIAAGLPTTTKGTVTRAFLQQVGEVCGQHGVRRGTVWGIIRAGRISLVFSNSIPPRGQQQLRNWWALSGWSPYRAESAIGESLGG